MRLDLSRLGAWRALPFFDESIADIEGAMAADTRPILPPLDQIFAAFERCQPAQTKVVILGQDPYPTRGHAHGFAFSAEDGTSPYPRSLSNIFKELDEDIGGHPSSCDLRFWADQGVLLLNTALTVPEGDAGGHARIGWDKLTAQALQHLADSPRAYVLWGKHAQKVASEVDGTRNFKIETAHPSPLSARRGFFGSRPFSRVNDWLRDQGQIAINWTSMPEPT